MTKATLDKTYTYRGKTYGPGEADVPDEVLEDRAITAEFRAALEGSSEEASGSSSPDEAGPKASDPAKSSANKTSGGNRG